MSVLLERARALGGTPLGRSVLSYLNLPPVGAIADGVPGDLIGPKVALPTGTDALYELPAALRGPLAERRATLPGGRFGSLEDVDGIAGVGLCELDGIATRLGDLRRYGHRVRPVWGGPDGRRGLLDLIDSAERSIHIQMYIIGGEIGRELMRRLVKKAEAGVEVRLLFTASGFIISGGPSGTGVVSQLSNLRSYLVADMYYRKRMLAELSATRVKVVDSAPIGRHWRRSSFKAKGIRNEADYVRWARAEAIPEPWLEEQLAVDEHCAVGFSNVDHRKMILVDGKRAFIGSQNIADAYFYENELSPDPKVNRARWQWHDNSSILEGGIVGELNRVFASRWLVSGGDRFDWEAPAYRPEPERVGDAIVATQATVPGLLNLPRKQNLPRLVASMFGADLRPIAVGDNPIRTRMMQLPDLAQDELLVEHCYPSDAELLSTWAKRAGRVPNFTFVVPKHYDTMLLGLECDRFFPELLAQGVKLAGYDRAIMHSKIAVVDRWYTATGSYNLTLRSARADLELEFYVQCPEFGAAVGSAIDGDIALSTPIAPTAIDRFRSRRSLPIIDALVRYLFL